jgi:hypothetical protein
MIGLMNAIGWEENFRRRPSGWGWRGYGVFFRIDSLYVGA